MILAARESTKKEQNGGLLATIVGRNCWRSDWRGRVNFCFEKFVRRRGRVNFGVEGELIKKKG